MGSEGAKAYFIVGGAGFIGSHFCDALLARPDCRGVTIYDNFSSGRDWHFAHHLADARFSVVRGDVHERDRLTAAMRGHDVVIHLASNPDIARAMTEPDIDFREGTALTNGVVEAMRRAVRLDLGSPSYLWLDVPTSSQSSLHTARSWKLKLLSCVAPHQLSLPLDLGAANSTLDDLLDLPDAVRVSPGPDHWRIFSSLCRQVNAKGAIVTDAYLAALAHEHGYTLVSFDKDFARFPGLRWHNPLKR
mgnify:CR=1 FL=1